MVGDIGGTNARLSLWETKGGKNAVEVRGKVRPFVVVQRSYKGLE